MDDTGMLLEYRRLLKSCEYVWATLDVIKSCIDRTGIVNNRSAFRTAIHQLDVDFQGFNQPKIIEDLGVESELAQLHQFCLEDTDNLKSFEEQEEIVDATVPYIEDALRIMLHI